MESEIDARLILEAQGRPKDKVEGALNTLIEELGKQAGVEIYDKKVQDTKETAEEGHESFFSVLADVGVKLKDFETLMSISLNFGPSAIVINSPSKLEVKASELQNVIGDTSAILHTFAQQNAVLRQQNQAMFAKLRELGALEEPSGEGQG